VRSEAGALIRRSMQHSQLVPDNFRAVPLKAIFACPFSSLQIALDVDQRAFFQMLPCDFCQPFVKHHAVPLGGIASCADRFVFPGFAGRDGQVSDWLADLCYTKFRVVSEVAN